METKQPKTEFVEPREKGICPECGQHLYRNKCFKCGIEVEKWNVELKK